MSGNRSGVSSDDIVAAYRMFLGRQPSAHEVSLWHGTHSLDDLRAAFLSSGEFIANQTRLSANKAVVDQKSIPSERLTRNLPAAEIEWKTDAATAARLVEHIRKTWTALGTNRPHWSVLSSDQFLPERIAQSESIFFASGADDLATLRSALLRHGVATNLPVFEYGCGIGRVTAHLAGVFPRVTACDISTSHLEMAQQVVGKREGVTFRLVDDDCFGMTERFGIWFSYLVLQHNPPPIIAMILSRMFKMLAPGGIALFQVPTYCLNYRFRVAEYLNGGATDGAIEVHCLPQAVIFYLAHQARCVALEVREDTAMGPPEPAWIFVC
jgi:SAM-dependent methyltransferase